MQVPRPWHDLEVGTLQEGGEEDIPEEEEEMAEEEEEMAEGEEEIAMPGGWQHEGCRQTQICKYNHHHNHHHNHHQSPLPIAIMYFQKV